MAANRRLTPGVMGSLAFGSVTNAYQAISGTIAGRGIILVVTNSLNTEGLLSLDGTNDFCYLPAGQGVVLDLSANDGEFSGAIYYKYVAAPGSGRISGNCVRVL